MSAEVIPLRSTFDPVKVELWSGKVAGRWRFFVDFVEHDGARCCMSAGDDLTEERQAARECADLGDGTFLPIVDLTGSFPVAAPEPRT